MIQRRFPPSTTMLIVVVVTAILTATTTTTRFAPVPSCHAAAWLVPSSSSSARRRSRSPPSHHRHHYNAAAAASTATTTATFHRLHHSSAATTTLWAMADSPPPPTTFREAEVLGLRLMQEGNYQGALDAFQKGLKLPGSRPDVVRTKLTPGPSPVGGASGGTESTSILVLDEFELQAAHYNMACAHARLGNSAEAVANLKLAFENGFDNYATVRADPDLGTLANDNEFTYLMEKYDPQQGFFGKNNPFGNFLKKA